MEHEVWVTWVRVLGKSWNSHGNRYCNEMRAKCVVMWHDFIPPPNSHQNFTESPKVLTGKPTNTILRDEPCKHRHERVRLVREQIATSRILSLPTTGYRTVVKAYIIESSHHHLG